MKYLHTLILAIAISGCSGGSSTEEQSTTVVTPTTPTTPSHPAQGTVLEESCNGTTLVQSIADGNGGSTQQETPNSQTCGYVAPPVEGTILDEYCDEYTLVTVTADGTGGEVYAYDEENEEVCGYEPPQFAPIGTPVGESYCGRSLPEDRFLQLLDSISHVLGEDRFQDYADGEGGTYTERTIHIDQTCFVQMEKPPECPSDPTNTGDSRYDYMTCDGIKTISDVDFPYEEGFPGIAIVDILVVFDSKITEEERDGMTVGEFVNRQIFEANHMYALSRTGVRLRLANIVVVEVAPGDLYRQYSAFFNGRYEFNGLDTWQRDANADIAFLFKQREPDPIACGVANLDATRGITKTRGITQCYHNSVFQEAENTRYYQRAHETFAHEVGHLLGAQHEWQDASSPGIFEYSFGYNIPGYNPQQDNPDYEGIWGGFGTIMSYADLSTGRFSDKSVTCYYPDSAGEYAGQAVKFGTEGGCFCLDPIENQPPPTDNVETLRRTRWTMSQLHEVEHSAVFSNSLNIRMDGLIGDNDDPEICLF